MDIKKVLVLGHSGFIGQRVMTCLREQWPDLERVGRSFPECNLTRPSDADDLAPLLGPDTAVILLSGIKRQLGDDLSIFEQNMTMVLNTARVLEEKGCARLVYVSSGAVYGEEIDNTSITEETPVNPMSYYGIAKYASERVLEKVCSEKGISLVSVRPPLVYGPGDAARCYGPAGFIHTALKGEPITLWGDGSELREFLFIDDLAAILCGLLFSDAQGVVNAVTGQSHNFREILDVLEAKMPDLKINQRERSKQKVDNAFDNSKLRNALPDFKFTPLADGVERTLEREMGK